MASVQKRDHDDLDPERTVKRAKTEETSEKTDKNKVQETIEHKNPLPPSYRLLGLPPPPTDDFIFRIREKDVGISEYIGKDVPQIGGIIKQRFTDFLVHEVDLDGNVIHIKSLGPPDPPKKTEGEIASAAPGISAPAVPEVVPPVVSTSGSVAEANVEGDTKDKETPAQEGKQKELWSESYNTALAPFFSEDAIGEMQKMFLEGPEPPRVRDSGWESKVARSSEQANTNSNVEDEIPTTSKKGRGGKSGRGGKDRGGKSGGGRSDTRQVLSNAIAAKATRTELHQVIRALFGGKLDSEIDKSSDTAGSEGSRVAIKWAKKGGGRGGAQGGRGERAPRGTYPPYIHFTMQKTNRDTQDALGHLSRILYVNVKDLSVAGTKDKRGVTVQRVSLKRGNKTVEDIWKMANGQNGRRTLDEALKERGERGVRIADLNYRKASLELGMLKGNTFIVTLRNVQVDSVETLDSAMNIVKHKGFINYYGMQRFGTASVPTHSIGLALLQSDWHKAVSLILQKRAGEHPDISEARDAWLVHGNLEKALELMPRRVVAERCILENYHKQGGETRNAMGALSTIPKNLRLMYIHAYQSYVWNAIVSERIRTYGADKPVPGDLVFDTDGTEEGSDVVADNDGDFIMNDKTVEDKEPLKKARRPWLAPRVKTLSAEDVDKYSIFDVIMPLPGKDVDYPGGALGEKYREFLRLDGLDPGDYSRKQKEYTLGGSYRKMLHLPKELKWTVMRYTDPDVPLAQADEDRLLGFEPPVVDPDGKFMALKIELTLGTAAYATMALREITKTETSSHFQSSLTFASEDQKFRGVVENGER